jgi:hypothetical protein
MWSMPSNSGSSPTTYGKDTLPVQEPCRFFLNGGCLRGDACPYSHELPDDRHLDVNNVGFIFTSGVQNSATALQRRYQQHQTTVLPSTAQPLAMTPVQSASPQQPPAYHHARAHQSPQPQQPTPALNRGSSVGSVTAQPFLPQGFTQQAIPTAAAAAPQLQYASSPSGPTSSIYTYGPMGQPAVSVVNPHAQAVPTHLHPQANVFAAPQAAPPMHVAHPGVGAPQPAFAPQTYLQQALPANVTLLQPPVRGSSVGPIPIVQRTDAGPYAPPPPLPYALPPHITIAYQFVGIPAGTSETAYGSYNQAAHHANIMATLVPVTASAA